jgi:hypothetical protein
MPRQGDPERDSDDKLKFVGLTFTI